MKERTYIAIDLKSFYASVECVERGLDPLTTNLVVADKSRTDKTICLAVSPSLKTYGIGGRPRLFEVVQRVRAVNNERQRAIGYRPFTAKSYHHPALQANADLELDYIVAPPRMAHYINYSTKIYKVYLKYISHEDIYPYSIDEVFIDATAYLKTYKLDAKSLVRKILKDVIIQTGITATAGIGTNMYLCKVAMDIVAKHIEPDENGARIAELDEMSYRHKLWNHKPLTNFWRIGHGTASKLEAYDIDTMGKIARCSLQNEDLLYSLFGVNAELLIDHAWGWEPVGMEDVKRYKPATNSLSRGQVLSKGYEYEKAKIVVAEMADDLTLNMVKHRLVTNKIVLTINYDTESLNSSYTGEIATDYYGRSVPKHSHGTINLENHTSLSSTIVKATTKLFEKITKHELLVRRITLTFAHVISEEVTQRQPKAAVQYNLFSDIDTLEAQRQEQEKQKAKERKLQETVIEIKGRFGKNSILKGINFKDGATAKERNEQIGGHKT